MESVIMGELDSQQSSVDGVTSCNDTVVLNITGILLGSSSVGAFDCAAV